MQGSFLGGTDSTIFAEKIREYLEGGTNKVILDLEKLDYMNSIGLGSLIAAYQMIGRTNGQLVLANIREKVALLLQLTQADKILLIAQSVEEAKGMFS